MTCPIQQPQAEGRAVMRWPISVLGDTGNLSAATSANQVATISITADTQNRRPIIAGIIWSYSGDPTGGRLTITTAAGIYLDLDIPKGGPGPLTFDPPIALDAGSAATIQLAAGGAGVTGKVFANCWLLQ